MSEHPQEPEQLLEELRTAGADMDAGAEVLDHCFDWRVIVPGPGGQVAEAIDGSAWRFLLQGIAQLWRDLKAWHRDPERRERAKQRREQRRQRRQERRS